MDYVCLFQFRELVKDDLPDAYNDWFLVKWLKGKCQIHRPISFNINKFIAIYVNEMHHCVSYLKTSIAQFSIFFSQEFQFEKCSEDVQSGTKSTYQFTNRLSTLNH